MLAHKKPPYNPVLHTLKVENEVNFEGFKFQLPEVRGKNNSRMIISDFYIWFSVCRQKDRRMIKDLYVIFGL
jgi:hypothetical protein